jgi:hypothetical protein
VQHRGTWRHSASVPYRKWRTRNHGSRAPRPTHIRMTIIWILRIQCIIPNHGYQSMIMTLSRQSLQSVRLKLLFFFLWGAAAQLGPRPPHCWGLLQTDRQTYRHHKHTHTTHTQPHNTHSQTQTDKTHTQQDYPEPEISSSHRPIPAQQTNISIHFLELEPATPAFQWLHSAYLRADRRATSITFVTVTERC